MNNINEPKRIRTYVDTHIWQSFCKLLSLYTLISNNLYSIIKNSICIDTINKIKSCKDHMYKSYEIKENPEKIKYANYSIEKLKLDTKQINKQKKRIKESFENDLIIRKYDGICSSFK